MDLNWIRFGFGFVLDIDGDAVAVALDIPILIQCNIILLLLPSHLPLIFSELDWIGLDGAGDGGFI